MYNDMSVSVDDLVTSLSTSHIGQEALDLAALQSQLTQTLFTQSLSSTSNSQDAHRDARYAQPCNTPTGRASFNWGQSTALSRRRSSQGATSKWNIDDIWHDGDQMDEDERMVEELLIPHSPMSVASASRPPGFHQTSFSTSGYSPVNSSYPYPAEPSASHFTTTDPFYMAQIQAAQNHSPAGSAQADCPTQQSPFLLQQPKYTHLQRNHGRPSPLDGHSILITTSTSFGS